MNKQLADLPGQQQTDISGLDTAKTNAFQDITNQANAKGMTYSGLTPAEQSKYIGATYLPGLNQIKQNYAGQQFKLTGALSDLESQQRAQSQSLYNQQATQEAQAAARSAASNPGINWGALAGGAAPAPAQAQAQPSAMDELQADLKRWLPPDYATRYLPGYTERTLIPKLQQLYPELGSNVASLVYQYRKQFEAPAQPSKQQLLSNALGAWAG